MVSRYRDDYLRSRDKSASRRGRETNDRRAIHKQTLNTVPRETEPWVSPTGAGTGEVLESHFCRHFF
jgi:hypothetical protein